MVASKSWGEIDGGPKGGMVGKDGPLGADGGTHADE